MSTIARLVAHRWNVPFSLGVRDLSADDPTLLSAWDEVLAELDRVDTVFSTYRTDSWASRLDSGELALADCPAAVAGQIREVLAIGDRAEVESRGAFSVRRDGRLDALGVVKGWAVDRAVTPLRALGVDWSLSAGGDVLCHVGDGHEPWRIGIEDPLDPLRLLAELPVGCGAVATSGSAHRGAHVVDARTGRPPTLIASVTVVAPTLTAADVEATAAYALDAEAAWWLADRGRIGLVVHRDGAVDRIEGFGQVSRVRHLAHPA